MEAFSNAIAEKFNGLLSYLNLTKKEFEMVADEVEDYKLKTACNGLSLDSMQYADELFQHLKTYGIGYVEERAFFSLHVQDTIIDMGDQEASQSNGYGDEVMQICLTRENMITKAYHEILNDHFPFPNIREIMTYQLNSLTCAFMKIKLLNRSRFA